MKKLLFLLYFTFLFSWYIVPIKEQTKKRSLPITHSTTHKKRLKKGKSVSFSLNPEIHIISYNRMEKISQNIDFIEKSIGTIKTFSDINALLEKITNNISIIRSQKPINEKLFYHALKIQARLYGNLQKSIKNRQLEPHEIEEVKENYLNINFMLVCKKIKTLHKKIKKASNNKIKTKLKNKIENDLNKLEKQAKQIVDQFYVTQIKTQKTYIISMLENEITS